MIQEQKQLLLKDLCARLPYGVNVNIINDGYEAFQKGEYDNTLRYHHIEPFVCDRIEIYPYLRPMSSMTEEEKKEFNKLIGGENTNWQLFDENRIAHCKSFYSVFCYFSTMGKIISWCNEHHFDYRGLIPMGLALEAPEGMYKNK